MKKVLKTALIETFSGQKTPKKAPRPPAVFHMPYSVWIGLLSHLFSQMPQKCNLPKISS